MRISVLLKLLLAAVLPLYMADGEAGSAEEAKPEAEAQTPLGEGSPNTSAESSTGSQTIENSAGSTENVDPNVQAGSAATMTPDSASSLGEQPGEDTAASGAADQSESATSSSASSALQDGATAAGVAGSPSEDEAHPAHTILDRLERKLQSTEAFVLGELLDIIAAVRRTL